MLTGQIVKVERSWGWVVDSSHVRRFFHRSEMAGGFARGSAGSSSLKSPPTPEAAPRRCRCGRFSGSLRSPRKEHGAPARRSRRSASGRPTRPRGTGPARLGGGMAKDSFEVRMIKAKETRSTIAYDAANGDPVKTVYVNKDGVPPMPDAIRLVVEACARATRRADWTPNASTPRCTEALTTPAQGLEIWRAQLRTTPAFPVRASPLALAGNRRSIFKTAGDLPAEGIWSNECSLSAVRALGSGAPRPRARRR
jgi:hypothetical protein